MEPELNPIESNPTRRHQRIAAALPVTISTIEPDRDPATGRCYFRASTETCINVSRGGVCVVTHEPLTAGRRLLIEVRLPGGRPLEAIGRVAWTRHVLRPEGEEDTGVGVEFVAAPEEQFGALEEFIRENSEP